MFAFAGPAYLVSVGYMDPGNWATDLEGGASFGYQLIWVLLLSNAMAVLLQTLSARLGIVTKLDLAQACRESYPRAVSRTLWVLCEVAIAACDLAEVLGAAIGLNLLFGLPLLVGVLLTTLDTLLILWFTRFGIRVVEAFVLSLVTIIGLCFLAEIWLAQPSLSAMATGLIPRLNDKSLYVAIGILGATVMPHNLYLHSALVQTRRIGSSEADKRLACKYNFIDSVVALNAALLVNGAILILAAATFFEKGVEVKELQQAHQLLAPLLGTSMASVLFATALFCSGQSSTLTGTLAGQIVMEGFLNFRMRPWLRRLITRAVQVVLSLQLPFAVIPLVQFTSDKRRMGSFASPPWVQVLAWVAAIIIVSLNLRLAYTTFGGWLETAGPWRPVILLVALPLALGLLGLLVWIAAQPLIRRERERRAVMELPENTTEVLPITSYRKVLVTLDHTERDRTAVSHALAIARQHGAALVLLHVEEGVTSRVYGEDASTKEVELGMQYFKGILEAVQKAQVEASLVIRHSVEPVREIVAVVRELEPDLVVMGAHGHRGIQDLIFGTTINAVRHEIRVPVLIVR
jgi:manganese transport protein